MDVDDSGTVSEEEFVKNCLENRSLLFPMVRYQLDLRDRILSHSFWSEREGLGNQVLPHLMHIRAEMQRGSRGGSELITAPQARQEREEEKGSVASSVIKHRPDETKHHEKVGHHNHSHHK